MEASMEGGVSVRAVKLKVLYTFDSEHRNNHLARWPHSLEVQAAPVDESSLIGIISLRTCLEAVITASPELTSNLDNDFTIYAYDYSEPDTPLVGQGMLSKNLSQEAAEDSENEAMVTGRISKSVMGLFSKNALETLEVKLRLTPVASATYQHRRSGSVCSNSEAVQQQWNNLSQTNNAFRPSSPMDTTGLETMQRMLSTGGAPRERAGSYQPESFGHPGSRPVSRSGTPTQSQSFYAPTRHSISQSRPASGAGMKPVSHARRDSFNSGYFSGEDVAEEGPARKRARIQKVDAPSKSNLNIERQPESLRVAASTASSVRLHRPVPQYPGIAALQSGNILEEPVRPPTPIPNMKPARSRGRPRKVVSANLLMGPAARRSSPGRSQEAQEPSLSSPEDVRGGSVTSTPADLPSSPPIMPEQQNFVTSPALPPLAGETDSGFMSGNLNELFDDQMLDFGDFLHEKPDATEQDQQLTGLRTNATMAADLPSVFDDANDVTQPTIEMPPPTERPESIPQPRSIARSQSFAPGQRTLVPAPRLAPTLTPRNRDSFESHYSRNTLPPQIPASDPVGRSFKRSNTWAPDMSDSIMSDVGPGGENGADAKGKKRVGKEQTRARLENAIAAGQMPPFCDNCGAIETPAWRRAFTKIFDTPYDEFQTSLEQGECCYKEPFEHNPDGTIKTWKGYRSEKRPDEKSADTGGWNQICLCNPCGLWFHKSKCPRPPEKWHKKDPNEKRKRKRGPKPKKGLTLSKTMTQSDAVTPASDGSSPADGCENEDYNDGGTVNDDPNDDNEPQLPPMPANYRAGSAEPAPRGLRSHIMEKPDVRQIQSSPLRGQQQAAPIEIDLTPRPLRRQLFPSPNGLKERPNAPNSVAHDSERSHLPAFVRRSPRLNKTRDVFANSLQVNSLVSVMVEEKENVAPVMNDDEFDDLFGDASETLVMPPSTPTPKRRSERILLKTPGRTPSRDAMAHSSPNTKSLRTPKAKHPMVDILINTVQRNLNPSEMTPFTRSIHDAFNNNNNSLELPQTPQHGSGRSRRTPRKNTPGNNTGNLFDFPDLPSLNGSSPMCGDTNFGMNLSDLTTDHLNTDYHALFNVSTTIPSSPPSGYFDFINAKDIDGNELWNEMEVHEKGQAASTGSGEDQGSAKSDNSSVRRSLRKHNV